MKTIEKITKKILPLVFTGVMALSGSVFGQNPLFKSKPMVYSSEHAQVSFEYEKDSTSVKKTLNMFEKFGIFSETKKREIFLSDKFSWLSSPNGYSITGDFKSFSDSTFKYKLFHENAHCYLKNHNDLNPIMHDLSSRMSGIMNFKIAETPGLADKLFTESTYIIWEALCKGDTIKSNAGHASSGPSELFASTSTILYFFPKLFFEFLEIIEKDTIRYPGFASLAKENARVVVLAYEEKNIFPEEVYEKLDIKENSKEYNKIIKKIKEFSWEDTSHPIFSYPKTIK